MLSTATACIFIKLAGGPSHLDTFSVCPGPWTPPDWDPETRNNLTLPRRLFPNILDHVTPHLAIVHSLQGYWDLDHMWAEYRVDAGRDRGPSIGSIVAQLTGNPFYPALNADPYGDHLGFPDPHVLAHGGPGYFPHRLQVPDGVGLTFTDEERARYGGTFFGDACLLATRLVTAGWPFTYISYGQYSWDHHDDLYGCLRSQAPVFDVAFSVLVKDLEASGLLAQTLIVAVGEFGRTPPSRYGDTGLNQNGGRDHFAPVHFALFAGGGVRGGRNIGQLNDDGSAILDPGWRGAGQFRSAGPNVRMEDLAITIYSALGLDARDHVPGGAETPFQEVRELFG